MTAATISKKSKAQPAVAPQVEEPASPPHRCFLTDDQHQFIFERLDRAAAVVRALVHVFGGDASLDKPRKVEGLMGVLQHADRLLSELNDRIMEIDSLLPSDLRWQTFEAYSLVAMAADLQMCDGFEWRWSDDWYCTYFDAADACIGKAMAALDEVRIA